MMPDSVEITGTEHRWPADQVTRRSIEDLIPYARNARTHSPAQVDQIAASMLEWGWTNPVLIDETGMIIAGHGRIMAAQKLRAAGHEGYGSVPTMVARGWTDAQKRAYILADNKLALNAGWDEDLLRLELSDLQEIGASLDLIGFTAVELSDLLTARPAGLTDTETTPDLPVHPVTVPGDVWLLGRHRVMCGDSTSPDEVERLTDGAVDCVYTDPPYGISVSGKGITGSAQRHCFGKILNDTDTQVARTAFNLVREIGAEVSVWWGANYYCDCLPPACSWLVWDKEIIGDVYSAAEMAWTNQPGRTRMFRHQWHGMVKASERGEARVHPTQKPVALAEWALTELSAGSAVLDLFGGSGSTLIACERTGRAARLMELDPRYADVIVSRWQDFTGQTATLEATGVSFAAARGQRPPNARPLSGATQ